MLTKTFRGFLDHCKQ